MPPGEATALPWPRPAIGGSFAFKGVNERAVIAVSLLVEATPFLERTFLAALALAQSE